MSSEVKVEEITEVVEEKISEAPVEVKEEKEIQSEDSDEESGVSQSALANLLQRFLGIGGSSKPKEEIPEKGVLSKDQLNMKGVAKGIKEGKFKNIIVMTGAGISVAAGIPDFRSPKTGLYATMNLQKYNINQPEDIFTIGFFKQNPEPFCKLAKDLFPGNYKPTKAHYFIRLLAEKGILLRNFTQNIDTLEREAKVPIDKIVEAHGSFCGAHCANCKKESSIEFVKEHLIQDKVPTCSCGGYIKPDIVFFGENLPERYWQLSKEDFPKCDLLIVMGTSLKVQPFCNLVRNVNPNCVRLLINRERVGTEEVPGFYSLLMGETSSGFAFDKPDNYRDAKWLGDVEDGIDKFVKSVGWKAEFQELLKEREAYKVAARAAL